jgi:hypothetical protein
MTDMTTRVQITMDRSNYERADRLSTPESWDCIDCGENTAPEYPTRSEIDAAFSAIGPQTMTLTFDEDTEIYRVKDKVWRKAGMGQFDGCLCIGCLEQRIGRKLKPKDFDETHPFSIVTGSHRLINRRDGWR